MEVKSEKDQCSSPSGPRMAYSQRPPCLKSISLVSVFQGLGAHHLSSISRFVHADQTVFLSAANSLFTFMVLFSLLTVKSNNNPDFIILFFGINKFYSFVCTVCSIPYLIASS